MIIKFEINYRSSHPLRFELEESLESMLGVIKVEKKAIHPLLTICLHYNITITIDHYYVFHNLGCQRFSASSQHKGASRGIELSK